MNDPVSFPCLLRIMGGWPMRFTFSQVSGHCSFDGQSCELRFSAGDTEDLVFDQLHRIRVVDQNHRGAFVDLHPKRRGTMFRVWIRDDEQTQESKAFVKYMKLLGDDRGAQEQATG